MADQIYELPDGSRLSLPEGATPEQVQRAVKMHIAMREAPQPELSLTQRGTKAPGPALEKPPSPQQYDPSIATEIAARATDPRAPEGTADVAVDALPMAGMVTGGLLASPGWVTAPAGAALGGAAGESFKQLINRARGKRVPATSGEAARDIGIQGAEGALAEVGGKAALEGGKGLAEWLYRSALKAKTGIRTGFGDLTRAGLDEAITVSPAGHAKAARLLEGSGQEATNLIDRAVTKGAPPATTADLRPGLDKIFEGRVQHDVLSGDEKLAALARDEQRLLSHGNQINLSDLQKTKQLFDREAAAAFKASDTLGPQSALEGETKKELANVGRGILEQRTAAVGEPGLPAINSRTQDLLGLTKALEDQEGKGGLSSLAFDLLAGTAAAGAAGPKWALPVAVGTHLIQSPAARSMAAIGIDRAAPVLAGGTKGAGVSASLLYEALRRGLSNEPGVQ